MIEFDDDLDPEMDMSRQEFVDNVYEFYGPDSDLYPMGATKAQISEGIDILLQKAKDDPEMSVVFDSLDRERVRDIMIDKFGLVWPDGSQ